MGFSNTSRARRHRRTTLLLSFNFVSWDDGKGVADNKSVSTEVSVGSAAAKSSNEFKPRRKKWGNSLPFLIRHTRWVGFPPPFISPFELLSFRKRYTYFIRAGLRGTTKIKKVRPIYSFWYTKLSRGGFHVLRSTLPNRPIMVEKE